MRKRFIFIILLLMGSMLIFNNFNEDGSIANFDLLKIEIGEIFEYLNYEKEMYVLNYEISDIDNDEENDILIVIGEKADNEDFYKNIDVVLYNKATETFTSGKLKNYEGKFPKIELNDVDGDGLKDAIITTTLENMDNSMRIVTFKSNGAKEIFKSKDGKGLEVTGQILDGFKARITIKNFKKEFEIDLSENKENYIASGFYLDNGKLNTDKIKVFSAGIYNIEFVNIDNKAGIRYSERIKGFDNLDIIDQLEVLIKYVDGNWVIVEVLSAKHGKII